MEPVISSDQIRFLILPFFPLFLISPFQWIKLNWMMPAYISGIIIASIFISRKMLRIQVYFSVVIHILLTIQVLFYVVPVRSDDTWFGWDKLASEIEKIQNSYQDTFIFSCDNYKTAATLNFYMDENIYSENVIGRTALQFDYIGTDLSVLNGKNAIFILIKDLERILKKVKLEMNYLITLKK